ncbi:hypothetical protein HSBAA_55930 [Vreelandella sulfidaeris]|uniref:Uncharacterized protein n=1 Tax=Vreelandella sulfidaeris TaxID=115553 RepID=A0A455UF42_9GAMM|nr:hypothetical protein HSBAA_55930 [Halomonas sulfidaeris]
MSQQQRVERGTELASEPVEGTPCLFRTCHDVTLYPLAPIGVVAQHTRESSIVELTMEVRSDQPMNTMGIDSLRLHLGAIVTLRARCIYG